MAKGKGKTVTVEALKYHTFEGEEYNEGDQYDVPADAVDNLVNQGMVEVVDDGETSESTEDDEDAESRSTSDVEPMDTGEGDLLAARKARRAKTTKAKTRARKPARSARSTARRSTRKTK